MNLKQIMENDLDNFYNSNEFGISALFNATQIVVSFLDDIEVSSSKEKVISAKSSDVASIDVGSEITVDSIDYEVTNFDYLDATKLEMIISIKEV